MMLAVTSLALATASKLCRVADYGAKTTDSGTKNTEAVKQAAADCAAGGTIVVDGGAYNVGPLSFRGKGLFVEIKDGSALVTMSGPDEWPVKDGNHETIVTPVWAESANVELDTAMFRVDLHACTPCCPLFRATNPWMPNVALRKPL